MINQNTIIITILLALSSFPLWQPASNAFGFSPPPGGGYPGFNAAEGDKALLL
jgi:hypothetical protein